MARELKLPALLRDLAEAVLRPYALMLFSRDLRAGLLVALAIATRPGLLGATLLAILIAHSVTLAFGLGRAAVQAGAYATTAALSALALGVFAPGAGHPLALVAAAAVLSVLLAASFEAAFASLALPTHSLPFIAATWTVHLAARSLPVQESSLALGVAWSELPAGWLAPSWLDLPASLLFLNGAAAGLLVVGALAVHSRISLLLAAIGAAVAAGMRALFRSDLPWSQIDLLASFNAMLAAMAIGGVWFVPQPAALLLAAGGAGISVVMVYALAPAAGTLYLPLLSLPFLVTTHLVLVAARRRVADTRPRSTLPMDRPEEALASHLMRVRRFGDVAWLPFRLPFRGQWTITQGYDGKFTHRGLWRHGLDFEVRGASGYTFAGSGQQLSDYYCYGLPVLAAGAGSVVRVVDGVDDNAPGEINTRDNWGNAVVVAHGAALYSVYAHLKRGSIRVKQGEVVSPGTEIARCGSSGRSPQPHLHFQIQAMPALGSPTIAGDFGDVVTHDDGSPRLHSRVVPRENEQVRPIMRDEALAHALGFAPSSTWVLSGDDGQREECQVEVDLLGRRQLVSAQGRLTIDAYEGGLVVLDYTGSPRSRLRWLMIALARVPFDQAEALSWDETLPRRLLLSGPTRALADLLAVFAPNAGSVRVRFRSQREPGALVVRGECDLWRSEARISTGNGEHQVELEYGGRRERIRLSRHEPRARGRARARGLTPAGRELEAGA